MIQWIFALLGALAAAAKLIDYAFSGIPDLVRWFSTGSLVLVVFYFVFIVLRRFRAITREEDVYKHNASRYGIGYDTISVEWMIKEDGSAQAKREVEVEAFSDVPEIDTFLLIPEAISAGNREISASRPRSLTPNWDVALTRHTGKSGSLSVVLSISPPLRKGDRIAYELPESLPSGLYAIGLTEEQLSRRATLYDYCGWNINRPSRRLSLRVYFPAGTKPLVYAGEVRYAAAAPGLPSERRHHEEEKRLVGPHLIEPIPGHYGLKLDVDYPMIGLIYVLRWQPTARGI